jgi:hypothetical protein
MLVEYEPHTAKIKKLEAVRHTDAVLMLPFVPQAFEHFLTEVVPAKI